MALSAQLQAALGDLLTPEQSAALDRLLNFYDGLLPYDPTTNPGGFRRGGQIINFDPALQDAATVLQAAGLISAETMQSASSLQDKIAQALAAYGSASALTDAVQAAISERNRSKQFADASYGSSTSAATSATTATTKADQAVTAASLAATRALNYDTLAALNADLSPANGVVAQVLLDPGRNGSYRKNGGSGSGSWVLYSTATMSGLVDRADTFDSAVHVAPPEDTYSILPGAGTSVLRADDALAGIIAKDPNGYIASALLKDGTVATQRQRVSRLTIGGSQSDAGDANYLDAWVDEAGNVVGGILDGELIANGMTPTRIADLANQLRSDGASRRPLTGLQLPTADFNTIVGYGQSLMMGQEAWPALSKTAVGGNVMLGGDVRPQELDGAAYTQVAPAGFQPLVARVRGSLNNNVVLTDAQVAALSAGDAARGETSLVGMANMLSWLIARRTLGGARPFNVVVPAVSGMTIEQLSKINGQDGVNRFNRFVQAVQQSQDAATALGKSHVVTAIVYMQGEWDYSTSFGSRNATKFLYKAALAQLHADMVASAKAITGQSDDPVLILYQTGAGFTVDSDSTGAAGLHVGMAQLEYALANPDRVTMAGPIYQVPDKGGHLDPNGSRWFGETLAAAYYQAVIEGRAFRPTSPTRVQWVSNSRLRVHFHVPAPPLVFDQPYEINAALDFSAKGFQVTDSAGDALIISVAIVAPTIVEITLARGLDRSSARVWYASKSKSNGAGCLRDSSLRTARDQYVYTAGSGQYASANISALVGKPYPLQNWCVAFFLPVDYSEA